MADDEEPPEAGSDEPAAAGTEAAPDEDRGGTEGAGPGVLPRPDGHTPNRRLMTPTAPLAPGAAMRVYPIHRVPPPPASPAPSVPAQWAEDPGGRHQWRWWNGVAWTDHVADDGEASVDPLP